MMPELIGHDIFQTRISTINIGFDPRYPNSNNLVLLSDDSDSRFWIKPGDAGAWPFFLGTILDCLNPWEFGDLYPKSGKWPKMDVKTTDNEMVRDLILRDAGVPPGWNGAIRFRPNERSALLVIMFTYLAFGWCIDDDLFFIPDHGRQIVGIDHHDVIHVNCTVEAQMMTLIARMESAGYSLPNEPPDATFKWPIWMLPKE